MKEDGIEIKCSQSLLSKVLNKSSPYNHNIHKCFTCCDYTFTIHNIYADNQDTIIHYELYSNNMLYKLYQYVSGFLPLSKFIDIKDDKSESHFPLTLVILTNINNAIKDRVRKLFSLYRVMDEVSMNSQNIKGLPCVLPITYIKFNGVILENNFWYYSVRENKNICFASFAPIPETIRKEKTFSLHFSLRNIQPFINSSDFDGKPPNLVSFPIITTHNNDKKAIEKKQCGIDKIVPIIQFSEAYQESKFDNKIVIIGIEKQDSMIAYKLVEKLKVFNYPIEVNFDPNLDMDYFMKLGILVLLNNENNEIKKGYIHLWNDVVKVSEVIEKINGFINNRNSYNP